MCNTGAKLRSLAAILLGDIATLPNFIRIGTFHHLQVAKTSKVYHYLDFIDNSVVVPSSNIETKLNAGAQLQAIPNPIIPKPFLSSNGLMVIKSPSPTKHSMVIQEIHTIFQYLKKLHIQHSFAAGDAANFVGMHHQGKPP